MTRKSKEIEPNVNNMSLITFFTSLHSLFEDSSLQYCYTLGESAFKSCRLSVEKMMFYIIAQFMLKLVTHLFQYCIAFLSKGNFLIPKNSRTHYIKASIFGTCSSHSAILPRKRSLSFLKFSFVHQSCIITKAASWRLAASARARSIRLGLSRGYAIRHNLCVSIHMGWTKSSIIAGWPYCEHIS